MTETVLISSQRTNKMIEDCDINVDKVNDSLLYKQPSNWNDLSLNKCHRTAVSSSTLYFPFGKPQEWSYRELHRNVFTMMDQARQYYREGDTALAIDAYRNTLDSCFELERRNNNSGENRDKLNQQISIMKHECRQQLDQMTNNIENNKSSSFPTTILSNRFDDFELYKTLNQNQDFTNNDQTETPHPLVRRRLIRTLMNKTGCNIYADPFNHSTEEQTKQESFAKENDEQRNRPSIFMINLATDPQKSPASQLIRQCIVCIVEQSLDQFGKRYSDQCQHMERIVCDTCVYKNTKSVLENIQTTEIRCPEPNCQAILNYHKVRRLLLKNNNRKLFDLYDQKLTNRHLERISEFIWCPYPGCGSGQLNQTGISNRQPITCIKCQGLICAFHRTKWHTNMTCDKYDRVKGAVADNRTKQWLKKYSKSCPQCKSPIEKSGRCDHMLCKKCEYQFCWECLADLRLIVNQGLHHHHPICSHYRRSRRTTTRRDACILS